VTFSNESGELYWTGTLLRANVPFKAVWNHKVEAPPQANTNAGSDLMAAVVLPVESYQAQSMLIKVRADQLRNAPNVYPAWVQKKFLTLPESVPERVLSLARELTAAKANPYDRTIAIQNYLRQFPYTTEVPAPPTGRDVADYFLFDLKQGYCDYYATTMVVLARAAGIPARLVIGYANGTYDRERAAYIVTENYAHSWVEIYFPNIGWVEFEPTAGEPAILYDEQGDTSVPQLAPPQNESFGNQASVLFQGLLSKAWIPFAALLILGLLWILWDAIRIQRMDPAPTLQLLFQRLRRLARPISGVVPLDETAMQYATDLTGKLSLLNTPLRAQAYLSPAVHEVHQLADLYSRSLFAPTIPGMEEAHSAIRTWSRLRWRLLLANLFMIRNKPKTWEFNSRTQSREEII
jgi:hypothetical protein